VTQISAIPIATERTMLSSILRSLKSKKSQRRNSRKRLASRHPLVLAESLEQRILLAAEVRLWDGGGATPDFALDANWNPEQVPDSDDIANFITAGQQAPVLGLAASLLLAVVLSLTSRNAASAAEKPARARKPASLVTYRFVARITDNAGVTPFKVGTKITGEFTYEMTAKNIRNAGPKFALSGEYESKRNQIVFTYGKLRFEAKGRVKVTSGTIPRIAEDFSVVSFGLRLPVGWKSIDPPENKKYRIPSFGVILQNYPPHKVLPTADIPKALDLTRFVNVKNAYINFPNGLVFPGGIVEGRVKIEALIEKLEVAP
jgi:hypothetical protein